jgi:hypothetical protein
MNIITEEVASDSPIQSPQAVARSQPIAHLALAPRFNIDSPNKTEDGKLAEIWAYAQGVAKSDNIPDVIWEVMHLEGVLGAPRLGESRLDRLYRYAKLKRQEAQIQRELRNVVVPGPGL